MNSQVSCTSQNTPKKKKKKIKIQKHNNQQMKGRKTQQPAEHIREEPRGKKKKKPETRKREEPGSVGLGRARRARPGLAWVARSLPWPGFFSLCFCSFFFFFFFFSLWVLLGLGSSGFFCGLYKLYKSSLKDSIFICSHGKICHVRNY